MSASLSVRHQSELYILPLLCHLVERLLQRELLASRLADRLKFQHILVQLHVNDLLQISVLSGLELKADYLRDRVPVAVAHALVAEGHD